MALPAILNCEFLIILGFWVNQILPPLVSWILKFFISLRNARHVFLVFPLMSRIPCFTSFSITELWYCRMASKLILSVWNLRKIFCSPRFLMNNEDSRRIKPHTRYKQSDAVRNNACIWQRDSYHFLWSASCLAGIRLVRKFGKILDIGWSTITGGSLFVSFSNL